MIRFTNLYRVQTDGEHGKRKRREENIPKSSRSVEMDWAGRIMSPSARENKLGTGQLCVWVSTEKQLCGYQQKRTARQHSSEGLKAEDELQNKTGKVCNNTSKCAVNKIFHRHISWKSFNSMPQTLCLLKWHQPSTWRISSPFKGRPSLRKSQSVSSSKYDNLRNMTYRRYDIDNQYMDTQIFWHIEQHYPLVSVDAGRKGIEVTSVKNILCGGREKGVWD